jgi:hypothetical protein
MEFMGIAVGILALICALVLLFGRHGTRKILGWGLIALILVLGAIAVAGIEGEKKEQAAREEIKAVIERNNRQTRGLSDAEVGLAPNHATVRLATPITILPALPAGFELDKTPDLADKITVTGPDRRIFVFSAGTERASIESYLQSQYGAPGTPRAQCWAKEPGPWCDYR